MAKKNTIVVNHVNIGTIGHADHGKTTLTAGVTTVLAVACLQQLTNLKRRVYRPAQKNANAVSPTLRWYETEKRHYAHHRRSRTRDYVKT